MSIWTEIKDFLSRPSIFLNIAWWNCQMNTLVPARVPSSIYWTTIQTFPTLSQYVLLAQVLTMTFRYLINNHIVFCQKLACFIIPVLYISKHLLKTSCSHKICSNWWNRHSCCLNINYIVIFCALSSEIYYLWFTRFKHVMSSKV